MEKKRIFVSGHSGMVGSRLMKLGCSPLLSDVTDLVSIDEEIKKKSPEIIIHLAAKTNVDEIQESPYAATMVNTIGSMNMFEMADKHKVPVIYLSGDHIFGGLGLGSYKETYDIQNANPVNFYGISKLGAELEALSHDGVKIVRTSALISSDRSNIKHYLDKIKSGEKVHPPVFLWRSFMHVTHFVESLMRYTDKFDSMPKVLHLSGSKNVSWYRLIKAYAKYLQADELVVPRFFVSGNASKAPRPQRAGLNTKLSAKLGFSQYDYMDGILEHGC